MISSTLLKLIVNPAIIGLVKRSGLPSGDSNAAEHRGPVEFGRIATLQAPNRHAVLVFAKDALGASRN
jgi:hypothetical protein